MGENKLVNVSIVFIALVLLVMVLKTLQSFLRPFVIAIILTFLLMPLIRFSKRTKIPFSVSLTTLIIALIALLGFGAFLLADELSQQLPQNGKEQGTMNAFQGINNQLQDVGLDVNKFFSPERINNIVSSIVQNIVSAVQALVTELFLVIIFAIFIIPSHEGMIRYVSRTLKPPKAARFRSVLFEIEASIRKYLFTKTLISLGTALASVVVMIFFQSDFIVVFAFLIFILNFIPNIGSFIAVLIVILSYFLQFGLTLNLLWFGLLLIGIQVTFGNILEPKIAGGQLKLSPIVILLSLFLWGWIWGIVGMLLAVPLTSIIKIVLAHIDSTKQWARYMG